MAEINDKSLGSGNRRILDHIAATEAVRSKCEQFRAAMLEACDLLTERKQGSPSRSAAHNARLVLEAALTDLH